MSPRTRSSTRVEVKSELTTTEKESVSADTEVRVKEEPKVESSSWRRKRKAEVLGDPKKEENFAEEAAPKKTKIEEHESVGEGGDAGPSQRRTAPKRAKAKAKAKEEAAPAKHEAAGRNPPPNVLRKALLIRDVMDKLYPEPPIPLDHTDSFTLLCGVLLSAQTTDGQVNEVTKELFRVAPDPQRLSKMSQAEVQGIIRSVGLAPTKAKHLIALSQQLLDRFDGRVPDNHKDLQSLPGVGRKTASVVMAQAFGVDAFPVDTHIHRLALRWGLTREEKNANKVEQDMMVVFPKESWSKLHLQLIYFGREHCQARSHDASSCPVCSWVKKAGPAAPRSLSDIGCLKQVLESPTPPKKTSKKAIMYTERLLELDQFKMKMEPER